MLHHLEVAVPFYSSFKVPSIPCTCLLRISSYARREERFIDISGLHSRYGHVGDGDAKYCFLSHGLSNTFLRKCPAFCSCEACTKVPLNQLSLEPKRILSRCGGGTKFPRLKLGDRSRGIENLCLSISKRALPKHNFHKLWNGFSSHKHVSKSFSKCPLSSTSRRALRQGNEISSGQHNSNWTVRSTGFLTASRQLSLEHSVAKSAAKLRKVNAVEYQATESGMTAQTLWGTLGQRVNMAGILFSTKVMVKEQHLAIPHVNVPSISWIDWNALVAQGFQGVLFDKDNTLTAPYGQSVWPAVNDALQECKAIFSERIALLSNSAGLYQYDPEGVEAKTLEDKLGIPVIRHGSKKPAGTAADVARHFGCDPSQLIMVGDRYFTDVVYGNHNGMLTIRCAPLTEIGEPFIVRQVRKLEDTMVNWWQLQGILPTKHHLLGNPSDFVKDPGCW